MWLKRKKPNPLQCPKSGVYSSPACNFACEAKTAAQLDILDVGQEMAYFTALSQAHASLLMEEALTENSLAIM